MASVEESIIETIQGLAEGLPRRGVRVGIGDDTAVLESPGDSRQLLVATDQIIENTHFIREKHPPRALGHKTLARGLSDIAAMGGTPRWFLLSLGVPKWVRGSWLKHYIYGMFQLARLHKIGCVGGDVARGGCFTADVCVVGTAPAGRTLTRGGARAGDLVYVSGRLGGSARGLSLLHSARAARGKAVQKHIYPQPRLALGRFLLKSLRATSAIDLSDGLSRDAARIGQASGVRLELDAATIPIFSGADFEQALHGGEEYELLFTVSPRTAVPSSFGGVPLSCIGKVRRGRGVMIQLPEGKTRVRPRGFEHFGESK